MAGDDRYLNNHHNQLFDNLALDPVWQFQSFPMSQTTPLRTADGPYLQIIEQPKQRGFRFRYGCEGPSHGGLPGASSEKNRKSYPTVKICNYQGPARVVVQLVTANKTPAYLHAHSLVGKQCDKGICVADLQPKDSAISFPNLGILHVTKKNVSKTLEERMTEAYRMGYNCGISIHPEMDALQGEVRVPRELTDHQRSLISSSAAHQSKDMDLSVVRLMFTAFLPDSDGGFSRRLEPVVSKSIYDSKAPNASNLKIVRMDRTAGCVTGGEEVYLLCDKVQKDDIQVRFYEEDDTGLTWEALGDFSPTDVHRQFAIVFKTPKYKNLNLQQPTSVFVQLKRKSDNETSEPKPFTYHPQIIDKEEVQRKRQKTLPNFQDFSGQGGGGGAGLYRGGGGTGGGPTTGGGGGGYFQGFSTYTYGGSYGNTGYSAALGPPGIKHDSQNRAAQESDDSDPDDDPASGAVLRAPAQPGGLEGREESEEGEATVELVAEDRTSEPDRAMCVLEESLMAVAGRHVESLFQYTLTGDPAYLLAPQRPLMTTQDEDGDTGLHLGVIHSQGEVVRSLAQVLSALPGEDVVNMRNHLYQTPLHLAVITQQKEAVEALLLAGADATLTDRHGNTVLHLAAQQEEGGMTGFLLEHKQVAELLEQPNRAGLCAVHLAVLANSLHSLRALLEGGANVEAQERSSGRTALHLATEADNVSLAGCLLLEGNADVDCCTYNGSTPLHIAVGRGSIKLTALLVAAGADPHKENFEPLFFREQDACERGMEEEEDDDEGYIPGTSPFNMAATPQVLELLNGKEYKPESSRRVYSPPQGDLASLSPDTRRALCKALEGGWDSLAHTLGLGILINAFQHSPSPVTTLLDSYEVSGGTIRELVSGLKSLGHRAALSILEGPLSQMEEEELSFQPDSTDLLGESLSAGMKLDSQNDSNVCDSGVELSTA